MSLLRTRFRCGYPHDSHAHSAAVNRLNRQLEPERSGLTPTVMSEGHPRCNGDGPLTINRSIATKEG